MGPMSAVAVAALVAMGGWGDTVDGNGKMKEETRQVPAFTGVDVGGAVDAEIHLGNVQQVRLVTDENLLPLLKTTVRDGVLHVDNEQSIHPSKSVKLYVVVPSIDRIEASGGTKVRAEVAKTNKLVLEGSGGADLVVRGIDTEQLSLDFSGGVKAMLSGRAKTAKVELSGGVTLTADGLELEQAKLDASGGVETVLAVSKSIEGEANGGVSVKVKGTPAVNVDTSGGSSIRTGL